MKVVITGEKGYDECDDCGMYAWENFTVAKDGQEVLSQEADTHLSGKRMWENLMWEEVLEILLPALGIELEINIKDSYET